jgi:hypothetical protein
VSRVLLSGLTALRFLGLQEVWHVKRLVAPDQIDHFGTHEECGPLCRVPEAGIRQEDVFAVVTIGATHRGLDATPAWVKMISQVGSSI